MCKFDFSRNPIGSLSIFFFPIFILYKKNHPQPDCFILDSSVDSILQRLLQTCMTQSSIISLLFFSLRALAVRDILLQTIYTSHFVNYSRVRTDFEHIPPRFKDFQKNVGGNVSVFLPRVFCFCLVLPEQRREEFNLRREYVCFYLSCSFPGSSALSSCFWGKFSIHSDFFLLSCTSCA